MATILVIDDNKSVRTLLKIILNRNGNLIITAADGREGIKRFDDNFFDLIITDFSMPAIDGNEVACYIRNSDRSCTPIIGISSSPWLFEENNFDLILQKPFTLNEIEDSVANLTDKHFIELLEVETMH